MIDCFKEFLEQHISTSRCSVALQGVKQTESPERGKGDGHAQLSSLPFEFIGVRFGSSQIWYLQNLDFLERPQGPQGT